MTKEFIYKKDTPILNVYAANNSCKYWIVKQIVKQKLIELKGKIDKFIVIVDNFKYHFLSKWENN